MIKLIDLLNERKQVGSLYHFTSYRRMIDILDSNLVLKSEIQPYVSFTRNKGMASDTITNQVKMIIDGTKLTDRYRIEPHADVRAGYGRGSEDESEERISLDKYPNGVDISKCLLNVEVKKPDQVTSDYDDEESYEPPSVMAFQELIQKLKSKRIPFKLV